MIAPRLRQCVILGVAAQQTLLAHARNFADLELRQVRQSLARVVAGHRYEVRFGGRNSVEALVPALRPLGQVGMARVHRGPRVDGESAVIVSLTHVRVPRKLPFAKAVLDYQKHRVKMLRRRNYN
jgi:hypothetical protein